MQDGFQVVPFSWVLAVKQLNEAFRERLVQMFGHLLRSDVRAHYELQKQLINKLQVGPRLFQVGLVLVGIYCRRFLVFKYL